MVSRTSNSKKIVDSNQTVFDRKMSPTDHLESVIDMDVRRALEIYQCAINRYNHADLSDPRVENVCFLERQIAYIGLQVALAKARLREGMDPSLDYTSVDSILKYVGM